MMDFNIIKLCWLQLVLALRRDMPPHLVGDWSTLFDPEVTKYEINLSTALVVLFGHSA